MLISIIIPALNEADSLPDLLVQLRSMHRRVPEYDKLELIVVDGGSSDDTVARCTPLADQLIVRPRGRSRQMNAGAQLATGDMLVFLHADTRLPANSFDLWQDLYTSSASWGFFAVQLDHPDRTFRLIEKFMNWRSKLSSIATGDQVLCIKRQEFLTSGGFADIELMEDVEYSKRLKQRSKPFLFDGKVRCSVRRWQKHGKLKTILVMWYLRAAYFFGADPSRLESLYYGRTA